MLFLLDGITYIFSAVSEYFMHIPQRAKRPDPPDQSVFVTLKDEFIEGFQYVWGRPGMRNFFMAVAVLNFFAIPVITLLAFFTEDFLRVGEEWYGFSNRWLWCRFGYWLRIGQFSQAKSTRPVASYDYVYADRHCLIAHAVWIYKKRFCFTCCHINSGDHEWIH